MFPSIGFYFSAFIIITVQLILMMYIYMLQPKLWINRLFAVYMFVLSVSSFSVLVASTSVDLSVIFITSQVHTLAVVTATPLLWLLVLSIFIPRNMFRRRITVLLVLLAILPTVLVVVDYFLPMPLLFVFDVSLYSRGYVTMKGVLNGRFGGLLYLLYISLLNTLLVIPLAVFAFSQLVPDRLRRAARILFLLSISVGLLYVPFFNVPSPLRSILTPVFASLGAAWVVSRYHFFSPMEMAMTQVVDTVSIGLLVFDEQLYLMDANAFANEHLPIDIARDKGSLTFSTLLQRLMPEAENPADLQIFLLAVQQKPKQMHQQEIIRIDPNNPGAKTWLQFQVQPVYDYEMYIGFSCLVEDLTIERRTQAYIAEAHQAIEQYAHNQSLLNEITRASISTSDFDKTLIILAKRLIDLFEADNCFISLWDEDHLHTKPAVAYSRNEALSYTIDLQPGEPSISYEVCRRKQAIAVEDVYKSPFISHRVAKKYPTKALLALPMVSNEQSIGALLIGFNQQRAFSPESIKWGEQIAQQLTLAISKNQLLAVEKEQRIFLEALQKAGQALTSTLDFEQVLDLILEEIAHVVPYDVASFALIERGKAQIVRKRDYGDFDLTTDISFTMDRLIIDETPTLYKMYHTKRPLRIANTEKSPDWRYPGHIKSWMGAPIMFEDEPIAFLMIDKVQPDFYQLQHEKRFVAFANYASLAIKHARLFTEIQRRVTELEALSTISAALRSYETVPKILQAVLKEMVEILSAKVGVAFLLDETETAVVSQASYPQEFYPDGIMYELGEGITGLVAQTGQVYMASEINEDPNRKIKLEEPTEIEHLRATIALPLVSEEAVLGVLHLGLDKQHQFIEDEVRTLKAMSNIVANGLQRIQLMQTLEARVTNRTFALETANERLKELDKLKTKFIADVSHELRTPVANLSIYINLLESGNPEKHTRYIKILQQQIDRLTNLVEATLGITKLEIGADDHSYAPVHIAPIIEEVLVGHYARAEALGLKLIKQIQPELPHLIGHRIQLGQLITNLVTNAINYNMKGGEITVKAYLDEVGMICVQVTDDGFGISEKELPHLFDRFYRGHRAGQSNIPGTGLGLSIVKEIVERHQGEISVQSREGAGTSFTVRFPVYASKSLNLPKSRLVNP